MNTVKPHLSALTKEESIDLKAMEDFAAPYSEDRKVRKHISKMCEKFVRTLFNDTNPDPANALAFCKTLESVADEQCDTSGHLANVAFYLRIMLWIAERMGSEGLRKPNYLLLSNDHRGRLQPILEEAIEMCNERSDLATSFLVRGMCHSFVGSRPSAEILFGIAATMGGEFIDDAFLDYGAYTYTNAASNNFISSLDVHGKSESLPEGPVILISVDENFMRRFCPYLFWVSHIMTDVHFHFHVIAPPERCEELLSEADAQAGRAKQFFGQSVSPGPSFSSSSVPGDVGDPKTYYACSRYLIAEQVMDNFDRDLYIMDADIFLDDGMTKYLSALGEFDVCMPVARGLRSLPPWRRFQAGNVFIKNNSRGRDFLRLAAGNISAGLHYPKSWMLDQNALSYAFDHAESDTAIGTVFRPGIKRPTVQLPFSSLVERR